MKIRGLRATLSALSILGAVGSLRAQTFYTGGEQDPQGQEDVVQVLPRNPGPAVEDTSLKPLIRLVNSKAYVIYETGSDVLVEDSMALRFSKGQVLLFARRNISISLGDFVAEMKRGSAIWISGDIRGDVELVNLEDEQEGSVQVTCLLPGDVGVRVLAPSETLRLRQGKLDWTSTDLSDIWVENPFFQELRAHPKDRFESRLLYKVARGAGVSGQIVKKAEPIEQVAQVQQEYSAAPFIEASTAAVEPQALSAQPLPLEEAMIPKRVTAEELLRELDTMTGVAPTKAPVVKVPSVAKKPAVVPTKAPVTKKKVAAKNPPRRKAPAKKTAVKKVVKPVAPKKAPAAKTSDPLGGAWNSLVKTWEGLTKKKP